jgi:hypothetical protein
MESLYRNKTLARILSRVGCGPLKEVVISFVGINGAELRSWQVTLHWTWWINLTLLFHTNQAFCSDAGLVDFA